MGQSLIYFYAHTVVYRKKHLIPFFTSECPKNVSREKHSQTVKNEWSSHKSENLETKSVKYTHQSFISYFDSELLE